MKCNKCKRTKPDEEFAWKIKKAGTRQRSCKECHRLWFKEYWQKNRARHTHKIREVNDAAIVRNKKFVADYLREHPCVDCSEADIIVLQFDHLRDKKFDVSRMVRAAYSIEAIKQEILKCEVRCANCHMRKTAERRFK